MSRFYDALKQASQSLFRSKENEELEEWGDWQVDGLEVPTQQFLDEPSSSTETRLHPGSVAHSNALGWESGSPARAASTEVASGFVDGLEVSKVGTTESLNSEPIALTELPEPGSPTGAAPVGVGEVATSFEVLERGSRGEGSRPAEHRPMEPEPLRVEDRSEPGRLAVSEPGGIKGSPESPRATSTVSTTPANIEGTDLPTHVPHFVPTPENGRLGTLAKVTLDQKARLIPHMVDPAVVEYYRMLRTKIMQQQEKKTFRSLVVTSPAPQDGKTVTVLNLGLTFAMLESFKVLVIDGDLRRGSLGQWLGVGSRPGLSNLIDGSARLEDVVLRSEEIPIKVIVRGNSKSPAAELLNSPQLADHFRKMAEHFDLVLVDSPPVNLVTDVQLLAGACDAVLLIARAFSTNRKALEKAVQDLAPFRVIGTALNAGATVTGYRRYRSYY